MSTEHDRDFFLLAGIEWASIAASVRAIDPRGSGLLRDSTRARSRFKAELAESKRAGFHKALADARARHESDADVYREMRRWLDSYHRRTTRQSNKT